MPVGTVIQSTYARTTAVNREFRRGFFGFSIPDFGGSLESATLLLTESRGQSGFPLPPDGHEIGASEADLVVDRSDYDAPTQPVAGFETDVNEVPGNFAVDVTALVNAYRGRKVGLRLRLTVDPDHFGEGFRGSAFQTNYQGSPARSAFVRSSTTEPLDPDTDQDGISDAFDNCGLVPNAGWCDSDDDDLNNNGVTNAQDGVILRSLLGTNTAGPRFSIGDFNCNGVVNDYDRVLVRQLLGQPSGRSGLGP